MKLNLKGKLLIAALFSTSLLFADNGLVGWACYNDLGLRGTTGGGDGQVVRATTLKELLNYAKAAEPYVILVEGSFTGSYKQTIEIASNKTIIGVGTGASFNSLGLNINGKQNIIIRNLTITNAYPDAIAFRNSHHVWVDHCDLSASSDGLLDFTIGSTYMTASWNKLSNHDKVSIANSGTQHFEDVGKNSVTYHHNWFADNTQRNPRVGYGKGHIFNNYYTNISSYCVGYHTGASVYIERNYFYKSKTPLSQMYSSDPTVASYADAVEVENIFDSTSGNKKGTGKSFLPQDYYDYKFALDAAADVPALAKSSCGPVAGLEYEVLPLPGNGAIDVSSAIPELAWTNLENVTSWNLYFGTTEADMQMISTAERKYYPQGLLAATDYVWKVDAVLSDATVIKGQLWHFRTAQTKATKPTPSDGNQKARLREIFSEQKTAPLTLRWTSGFGAVQHKVYIGESASLTESDLVTTTASASYRPDPLKYGIHYYWKVNSVLADGSEVDGDVWNFSSDVVYIKEGKTEVEKMILNGRAFLETQDGTWFLASNKKVVAGEAGPGAMSAIWNGEEVKCDISLGYFDESDGNGFYAIYVNENLAESWKASANSDKIVTHTVSGVHLCNGDELRVELSPNAGEMNRTDYLNIAITETVGVESVINDMDSHKPVSVRISDLTGRVLYSAAADCAAQAEIQIAQALDGLSSQMYFVVLSDLETGEKLQVRKVIRR